MSTRSSPGAAPCRWLRLGAFLLFVVQVLPHHAAAESSSSAALHEGSAATQAAVLWIRWEREPAVVCRASLVAEALLLTSASCVVELPQGPLICDAAGLFREVGNGSTVGPAAPPEQVLVYAQAPSSGAAAIGRGTQLYLPELSLIGCSNNLAFVVVEPFEPLPPPLAVDLRTPLQREDVLFMVSPTRQVAIEDMGTWLFGDPFPTSVWPGVLATRPGACPQDAGTPLLLGPAPHIVGVAQGGTPQSCAQTDSLGYATHLAASATFIRRVYKAQALTPPQPPRGDLPPLAANACHTGRTTAEQPQPRAGKFPLYVCFALLLLRLRARRRAKTARNEP